MSPSEAKKGANLISKLTQLGIKPNKLESYIEASTKISKEAGYEPRHVIEAAMTLSNLEAKAGKSYVEALQELEPKIKRNRNLKKRNRKLQQEIRQKLVQNKLTESEIDYIAKIRENLLEYDITLAEVESLCEYLQNMEETNGDPRKFTEYTRKVGTLSKRLAWLEAQAQLKTRTLQALNSSVDHCKARIDGLLDQGAKLREEIGRKMETLKVLHQEENDVQEEVQQKLTLLSSLLEVENEGVTIREALDSAREKLCALAMNVEEREQNLQFIRQAIHETEIEKLNLEEEITEMLNIKDYVEEKQAAIARLEDRETYLEEEVNRKSDRLALADTITNFLTRQPSYDFTAFHAYVQSIKYAKERGHLSWPGGSPILEEKVRMLALKAFEGNLVSTLDYQELQSQKSELEEKVASKEKELKETRRQLEHITNENAILGALKLRFEGQSSTLQELNDWVAQIYNDQIENRANEKCKIIAAGTSGILDFIHSKIKKPSVDHKTEGDPPNA